MQRGLGFVHDVANLRLRILDIPVEVHDARRLALAKRLTHEELSARYQKITGGLSVDWDGERETVPQLQPFLKSKDRATRERAFRLGGLVEAGSRVQVEALVLAAGAAAGDTGAGRRLT